MRSIVTRSRAIVEHDGLLTLFKSIFLFLAHRIFIYETYFLNETPLEGIETDPEKFLPDIPSLTYKFIQSNKEADELETRFKDFRLYHLNARERLDSGAIAFCIFVGNEPAYICWMAMSETARQCIDKIPYAIEFTGKEAFMGGELTVLKYRRKGLKTYGVHLRNKFLKELGVTKKFSAITVRNKASLKALVGRKNFIYAKALYIKIFGWVFWKEVAISPPLPIEQLVSQYK